MTRDHMMGAIAPSAADLRTYSANRATDYPLGVPVRVMCAITAAAIDPAAPTLADYLPTGVTQCSDSDRRGISRNPEIRAVRFRGVLIEFNNVLGQVMGYDTCDC